MTDFVLTPHAEKRCQQRGITAEILDVLLAYGRRRRRHGADIYFMDKAARRRARGELGGSVYARLANRLNAYAVVTEDSIVITAARRLTRLKF